MGWAGCSTVRVVEGRARADDIPCVDPMPTICRYVRYHHSVGGPRVPEAWVDPVFEPMVDERDTGGRSRTGTHAGRATSPCEVSWASLRQSGQRTSDSVRCEEGEAWVVGGVVDADEVRHIMEGNTAWVYWGCGSATSSATTSPATTSATTTSTTTTSFDETNTAGESAAVLLNAQRPQMVQLVKEMAHAINSGALAE